MPVTDLVLVWLGTVGLAVTGAQLLRLDTATQTVSGYVATVVWGTMGLAAYSVHADAYAGTEPMRIVVMLGFALAALMAVVSLYHTGRLFGLLSGARDNRGITGDGGGRR